MAFTGKNPRFTSTILTDALATTPSSPPSGAHKLVDRNGAFYLMDSTGSETPIGAASGEKNYILTPSIATGWTASGAGLTVAVDTTAADLPRANTTKTGIKFTGVSGSSAYAYRRFIIDPTDYGVLLKIKIDFSALSGYTASDFKVDLYSNTASNYAGTSTRVALSTDSASISAIPNATQVFQCTFTAPTNSAPYMELRIGLNAAATSSLVASDIVIGPGTTPSASSTVSGLVTSYDPGVKNRVKTVSSADYTILDNDGYNTILVTTGASQRTITLPAVGSNTGRELLIKKVDSGAGTILIDTPGSETIDGSAQNVMHAQYSFVKLVCDGTNWSVLAVWDQMVSQVTSAVSVPSAGTFTNITSLAPTGGTWNLYGADQVVRVSGQAEFHLAVSANTGNTTTDHVKSQNYAYITNATLNDYGQLVGPWKVVLTASTTYFLKFKYDASTQFAANIQGTLTAQRIG